MFAGLLLSSIPLLEFEGETELVDCLKKVQTDFINALKDTTKSIRMQDFLNPLELNACVRKYKKAINVNIIF